MCIPGIKAGRAILATILFILPSSAAADPVVVTSGQMVVLTTAGNTQLLFEGQNFTLQATGEPFVSTIGRDCVPCEAGTILDLGGAFDHPFTLSGTAVVDGVTYPSVWLDGMTGTFSTAALTVGWPVTTAVSLPFTYSGTIVAFLENPMTRPPDALPLFTKSLVGGGIATTTFQRNQDENPLFSAPELRYEFENVEPVPEPATMLLCGAGVAVLAARRRRRT